MSENESAELIVTRPKFAMNSVFSTHLVGRHEGMAGFVKFRANFVRQSCVDTEQIRDWIVPTLVLTSAVVLPEDVAVESSFAIVQILLQEIDANLDHLVDATPSFTLQPIEDVRGAGFRIVDDARVHPRKTTKCSISIKSLCEIKSSRVEFLPPLQIFNITLLSCSQK